VASKNKPEARERSRRKKKVTQDIARLLGLPQEHEEESKPQQPEGWDLSRCRDARVGLRKKRNQAARARRLQARRLQARRRKRQEKEADKRRKASKIVSKGSRRKKQASCKSKQNIKHD
jgi:hypothetical protein